MCLLALNRVNEGDQCVFFFAVGVCGPSVSRHSRRRRAAQCVNTREQLQCVNRHFEGRSFSKHILFYRLQSPHVIAAGNVRQPTMGLLEYRVIGTFVGITKQTRHKKTADVKSL